VGHYRPHELITHLLRSTARMPRRNTKAALAPEDVDSYVKCLSKVVVVRMMKHNKNGMSHDHLPILALLHFGRSRGFSNLPYRLSTTVLGQVRADLASRGILQRHVQSSSHVVYLGLASLHFANMYVRCMQCRLLLGPCIKMKY
jgi:hypothetical protein